MEEDMGRLRDILLGKGNLQKRSVEVQDHLGEALETLSDALTGSKPRGPRVCRYDDPVPAGKDRCVRGHYVGPE